MAASFDKWEYSDYSKIDPVVEKLFPFDKPRENQLETISEIKKAIDDGYKYIVLEAGTGTGKSAIAATLASIYNSSYILTITKQLQEQYINDFKDLGFSLVKGRGNFACRKYAEEDIDETCDFGRCKVEGYSCEYKTNVYNYEYRDENEVCSFDYQKCIGLDSDVVISNYPFFFIELNYLFDFRKRDLLICDEAHNLESVIMDLLQIEFSRDDLKENLGVNLSKQTVQKLENGTSEDWVKFINKIIKRLDFEISKLSEKSGKSREASRKLVVLHSRRKDSLQFVNFIKQDPDNWIVDYDSKHKVISFKPVKVHKYAKEVLFKHGDVCLFLSATILDYKLFSQWLGIEEDEIYAIRRKSPFDIKRNPIITYNNFPMNFSSLKKTAPKTIPLIKNILNIHKHDKGIIHTVSYNCKEYLKEKLDDKRLIDHKTHNRISQLNKFEKSKKPLVLISPSMNEGVDLPGDKCRFQIIYKIPYPNISDKQTKIRSSIEPRWYEYKTCISLLQTYGRGMRSVNDYCKTYFMDSRLKNYIKRDERTNKFLPGFFRRALNVPPELVIQHDKVASGAVEEVSVEEDSLVEEAVEIPVEENILEDPVKNTDAGEISNIDEVIKEKFELNRLAEKLLENKNYDDAVLIYKSLLHNDFFKNDYYPFQKLVEIYHLRKKYDDVADTIIKFYNSGIYCDKNQLKWFKKKLASASKNGFFDESKIDECEAEFFKKGNLNEELANSPIPSISSLRKENNKVFISKATDALTLNKLTDLNITKEYFDDLADDIASLDDYKGENYLIRIRKSDYVDLSQFDDLDKKADLIRKGKELEKEDYEKSVEFYNELKDNPYFINDYYPFRRLCILHKRNKSHERDFETILDFFKRKIYCNNHQLIWFKNKVHDLANTLEIDDSEINNLIDSFEKNRLSYKDLQNNPLPLAERFRFPKNNIKVITQEKYDYSQSIYYLKECGAGFERNKDFKKAIEFYIKLFGEDLLFFKYHAYKRLAMICKNMKNSEEFIEIYNSNLKQSSV